MSEFAALRRQEFRDYFQPSRLVLCILPDETQSLGVNVLAVCFCMHCSYKPPMMAIAIHDINRSYELMQKTDEYVLAVPGERLAAEAMQCGVIHGGNKVQELGLNLVQSCKVSVPGLRDAIANIELRKAQTVAAGDHLTVIGEVLQFGVNIKAKQRPLLSVGRDTRGYAVLVQHGVDRIAVVDHPDTVAKPVDPSQHDRAVRSGPVNG